MVINILNFINQRLFDIKQLCMDKKFDLFQLPFANVYNVINLRLQYFLSYVNIKACISDMNDLFRTIL